MTRRLLAALLLLTMMLSIVPAFAQEPIEIPVWVAFTDYRLDWANEKAAEFNEMFPQYNVVITGYPNYEELFTAVNLAAEQGSLPAIVHLNEVNTQAARDSGYFNSIAEALGDRAEVNGVAVDMEDFVQPVTAYYTFDGSFTSMPWNTSSAIWFSNMGILSEAGIDTPPATWAEVETACDAIMVLETAPEYCFTFPNNGWFFEQWVAQQDTAIANNDNGRTEAATEVDLDSPAAVSLLTWLKDMHDKGYLYYSGAQGGDSWATVDQSFLGSQTAMAAYSSSDTAYYTNTGADNGFDVTASFLPYNQETGWTGNIIGGATLWLVGGLEPEAEDGALTFLLWFSNTENSADWHQTTGYMPIRQSSVDLLTGEGWFEENPNFAVASDQIAQSSITPATQGALLGIFNDMRNIVTQSIDTVLLTDSDPATVLADAEAEANSVLEEYNLLNAE